MNLLKILLGVVMAFAGLAIIEVNVKDSEIYNEDRTFQIVLGSILILVGMFIWVK